MSHPKILIERCSKTYGQGLALSPVDLTVPDSNFTCLLGPSGCGKSTLLNMIAGFVRPTSGRICVDGVPVDAPSADRGVVFQEFGLFPWRTARANIEFGLQMKGQRKAERRQAAARYLDMVGLSQHADKYPASLSGGMKQRVAIARALAAEPSVLLMDEPFGALDAQTRETMQDELLALWERQRKTVVFITHSISESVFLADQIVVMHARPGRIRAVIDVSLPRPRDRQHPDFAALERRIKELIREEQLAIA